MGKFVYILKDYDLNQIHIKNHEVGIVKKDFSDTVLVSFVNETTPIELPKYLIKQFNPLETGDGFPYKVCNRCHRLLETNKFQINQTGKDNRVVRRPSCIYCREEIDGINVSRKEKSEWAKTKPHLEIWECPICKKRTIPGLTSKVVLDHNHLTGKARAWICDSCNTGLGRFKDNIKTMENAISYLKEEEKKE